MQLMKIKRAAALADCHSDTISRAIDRGEIEAVYIGLRGRRLVEASFRQWQQQRQRRVPVKTVA
jgi:excisionase family DNA binding protein